MEVKGGNLSLDEIGNMKRQNLFSPGKCDLLLQHKMFTFPAQNTNGKDASENKLLFSNSTLRFTPGDVCAYKTKPCQNMERDGKCVFGAGCFYYHNNEERREYGQKKDGVRCPFYSRSSVCYFDHPEVVAQCPFDHD